MQGVNVKSEIGNLKKVILHRPGNELLNLTPNTLEELLFDDIPFLEVAQADVYKRQPVRFLQVEGLDHLAHAQLAQLPPRFLVDHGAPYSL